MPSIWGLLWKETRGGPATNPGDPPLPPPRLVHLRAFLLSSSVSEDAQLRWRGVCVQLLRKERSVGVVPQASTIYEVLEELAIAVQVRRRPNANALQLVLRYSAPELVPYGRASIY